MRPIVEKRVRERLTRYYVLLYGTWLWIVILALMCLAIKLDDWGWAILLMLALVAGGIVLHRYKKQPERRSIVLWIRRFHRGDRSRAEQRFLQGAVYPWGTLVTLADSAIDSAAGYSAGIWVLGILLVAMTVAGPFGLWKADKYWGSLASIAVGLLAWINVGKVGLKSDNWTQNLAELNSSLRRWSVDVKDDEPMFSGSVLNCPLDTERWRDVIQVMATVADAVVLSVPEITSQVEWELSVLMTSLGPDKIIFATDDCGASGTAMAALKAIQIPEPASSWLGRYAKIRRKARKNALETILRAIESHRPDPPDGWSSMTHKLEAWSSSDDEG